jgi:hypothetical protein
VTGGAGVGVATAVLPNNEKDVPVWHDGPLSTQGVTPDVGVAF